MLPDAIVKRSAVAFLLTIILLRANGVRGATVFLEAESFAQRGGWTLDTQFIEIMGSPYLLAHGMGRGVADAETKVTFPVAGSYRLAVRTKDWVAHWKVPGAPGKFQVLVDGQPVAHVFGAKNAEWSWENGGAIAITTAGLHTIGLHDLTGFDGRCDALFLTTEPNRRPPESRIERKQLLGLPEQPPKTEEYDLVVCGGGYSGMGTAISAARQGLKVALVQDRPVLGGNGSSEIQVWAQGGTRRGLFPRLGEIVEEFADHAQNSPGAADEFGDAHKEAVVRAEKNISLFLNSHVIGAETRDDMQVRSVLVLDTRTGAERRFRGKFFADCTGHGTIGALTGAKHRVQEEGHMGMSNMWKWDEVDNPPEWPETPWALPLEWGDFPPTKKAEGQVVFYKGEWFWESGFNKHPLKDLEYTRDWNLRATYGAFSAMKRGPRKEQFSKARLEWIAAIGGTRESRLLDGDVLLGREDIEQQRSYPDGCVPTTWDIDLHYPKEQYAKKFSDDPFISRAEFGSGVDKKNGYPIPYRCFYSTNIGNLFMAGRCISVTHGALGTIRVMRTCGMMGEVVGKAAYLCVKHTATPRAVYEQYLDELKELMRTPGAARRDSIDGPLSIPSAAAELPPRDFREPGELEGIVVDDTQAIMTGKWTPGQNLKPFIGAHYLYASPNSGATARFEFTVPKSGRYEVRVAWSPHQNRASNTPCVVETPSGARPITLNQREKTNRADGFQSLGEFEFEAGRKSAVSIATSGANGFVHIDCVQVLEAK
jgi:hypothetical protein